MRKIVVAGSIIVDKINEIPGYPREGELVQIRACSKVPGGLVPNTGSDIHILDPEIPVSAFGAVGDDDEGRLVVAELRRRGLNTAGVVIKKPATSFTEVMSVRDGERTFFTYPGASAEWGYEDFPFAQINEGDIVLLGYFLLLAKIDAGDGKRILEELKRRGAKTAIDLVSEDSERYALVREALPYVDYLIINEVEAKRLGEISTPVLIVHSPEEGIFYRDGVEVARLPSFKLPKNFIKGKTGAGDAYCAGCLVGIYRGLTEKEILNCGRIAATGSLSAPGATEGMKNFKELKQLCSSISIKS